MRFEEMKRIWDSETNRNVYAINEEALYEGVIAKTIKVKRDTNFTELYLLGLMLCLALMTIVEGFVDKEYYQLPEGLLLLLAAANIFRHRLIRRRTLNNSDQSLLGDLRQAIKTINYFIERQRMFFWWFVAPILGSQVIHFAFTYKGKPWWLWVCLIVAFCGVTIMVKRSLKKGSLPMKKDLEAIQKLLEADS